MKITTLGAIDIGSNAIRLLVKNIEDYTTRKEFKKVAFIRVPIRLGSDVFMYGEISKERQEDLLMEMKKMVFYLYQIKTPKVILFIYAPLITQQEQFIIMQNFKFGLNLR